MMRRIASRRLISGWVAESVWRRSTQAAASGLIIGWTSGFRCAAHSNSLAAAAVLKRVDEQQENLQRFVPYGAKDILVHAPVTKEHLKDGGMTLGALCEAAIA